MKRQSDFSRVPLWWQRYVNGRGVPSRSAAMDEVFQSDPPSTMDKRFLGEFPQEGAALDRLIWRRGFYEARWLDCCNRADWDGVSPELRALAGKVILQAKDWGVPLYVPVVEPCSDERGEYIIFAHCRYQGLLSEDEWAWIDQVVRNVSARLDLDLWPGAPGNYFWPGAPLRIGLGVPLRLTPLVLSRSLGEGGVL